MRTMVSLGLLGAFAAAAVPQPAEGQLLGRMKERVRTGAEERKRRTEDNLVERAAEPADSAVDRVMAPVDSLAGSVAAGAGAALAGIGRGSDEVADAERRIRAGLAGGRADLEGLGFEPGGETPTPASEPVLEALSRVLVKEAGVFLLQARADPGMPAQAANQLAARRAVALKGRLVAAGVPGERLFATGDNAPVTGGAWVAVARVE